MPEPARGGRPAGRREALCLIAAALLTAALFANGTLDVAVARAFYHDGSPDHWPLAHELPWSLLYRAAPWVTALLVVAGLTALAASFARARHHWRRGAVLVLLGVALGPGLLANVLFKDHWQHPRPRDLIEFGGPLHYVPSPLIGWEAGASFPCGHCSVGFMCAAGWWIWSRRRPTWAAASLAGGLALGLLLGGGRMAAGAHFLSDIFWSALLAFAVLHLLWYHVLPVPAGEETPSAWKLPLPPAHVAAASSRRWRDLSTLLAPLAGLAVLLALFVTPHGTELAARAPLTSGSPRLLEVVGDAANVTLVLLDEPQNELIVEGELHGFGLPGSRLTAQLEQVSQPQPALRYRIEARGWLTDVDGAATVRVPAGAFDRVAVRLERGNIRLSDLTRAGAVANGHIRLELRTDHGRIQRAR